MCHSPVSVSPPRRVARRSGSRWPAAPGLSRWALLVAFACSVALAPPAVSAGDIVIDDARIRTENDILLLDASATFEFGADALAALNSGIPLVIELDLMFARERRFLWDSELLTAHRRYSLEYHALAKKFIISDPITGERRPFTELEPAIAELGRIRDLAIAEAGIFDADAGYRCALRLRLDLDSLPAPMIPLAYVSPSWHMSSGWYRWQITR